MLTPALFVLGYNALLIYMVPFPYSVLPLIFGMVWKTNVRKYGWLCLRAGIPDVIQFVIHSNLYLLTCILTVLEWYYFVGFRSTKHHKYVFIIGHPRSATTYVHHNLINAFEGQCTGMAHLIGFWPSFCLRETIGPSRDMKNEDWEQRLNQHHAIQRYEEEDQLLGWGYYNHFPIMLYSQKFRDLWQPRDFMHKDYLDLSMLKRVMEIQMVRNKRHLWIGKPLTHTIDWKMWKKTFPGARFILVKRDPVACLKSTITMYYNLWPSTPERIFDCFESEKLLLMEPQKDWGSIHFETLDEDTMRAVHFIEKTTGAASLNDFKLSHPTKCKIPRPPLDDPSGKIMKHVHELAARVNSQIEEKKAKGSSMNGNH